MSREVLLVAATELELCEHPGLACGIGPVEAAAATGETGPLCDSPVGAERIPASAPYNWAFALATERDSGVAPKPSGDAGAAAALAADVSSAGCAALSASAVSDLPLATAFRSAVSVSCDLRDVECDDRCEREA